MGIVPIPEIRPFSVPSGQRADGPAPRFEVEASARTSDETYSPSRQAPDRGLEGEAESEANEETAQAAAPAPSDDPSGSQIDIIA